MTSTEWLNWATYPDATPRGYHASVIAAIRSDVAAHVTSVNSTAGATGVVTTEADRTTAVDVWPTAVGDPVTMAGGVKIALTSTGTYSPLEISAGRHTGPVLSGYHANDFIDAANTLPGITIAPYTDAQIRANSGIIAGSGAVALGGLAIAGAGAVAIQGAVTLGALTTAGAGSVPVAGAGAVTLGAILAAGTGILPCTRARARSRSERSRLRARHAPHGRPG